MIFSTSTNFHSAIIAIKINVKEDVRYSGVEFTFIMNTLGYRFFADACTGCTISNSFVNDDYQ